MTMMKNMAVVVAEYNYMGTRIPEQAEVRILDQILLDGNTFYLAKLLKTGVSKITRDYKVVTIKPVDIDTII